MSAAPRVVMLVDNGVEGDSRVQKAARSMADAGWDVVLLGRTFGEKRRTWRVGAALVQLEPSPRSWNQLAARAPGRSWRHPLAYPDRDRLAVARARADWWDLDAATRGGTAPGSTARAATARLSARWRRLRLRQTRALLAQATGKRSSAGLPSLRRPSWAWDDPDLADLEIALAPALEKLAPDLIHAHDFRSIGIAVRSADRLQRKGSRPVVVYDAHEFLPGVPMIDERRRRGLVANEATHIRSVDAVVTVSEQVADLLVERHGLPEHPTVVRNCPETREGSPGRRLRDDCGIADDVPLAVYVGVAAPARGLVTLVDALPSLPDLHAVLVTQANDHVTSLVEQAARLGFGDRLHVVPYVAADAVSAYVRDADVAVSPLLHTPNHDVALPTKLFEYARAGLPVVTSDVPASAELVGSHAIGEVFAAGDVAGLVVALRRTLLDRDRYAAALTDALLAEWSWEHEAARLDALYRRLLGRGPSGMYRELRALESALAAGEQPDPAEVGRLASELMRSADDALARADQPGAVRDAARAADLLAHRTLHFDGPGSPLPQDPGAWLAPWRSSAVAVAIADRAREATREPRTGPASPPPRVVVLSYVNFRDVPPVERVLRDAGAVVDRVDLAQIPGLPVTYAQQISAALTDRSRVRESAWARAVVDAVGPCDTVWIEWAQRGAVPATLVDLPARRRIVRLHSFEAWTLYPQLVDWGQVDDLVFVGPHLRDMVVPVLPAGTAPATHVLPVALRTEGWHRPKTPGARKTLAVVGWSAAAKDVVWALDLLARLRARDPEYRLLVVGKEPDPSASAGAAAYLDAVRSRAALPDVSDAVTFVPHTPDVVGLLAEVGVLVSSSLRESLHIAVLEGAASGAVPVVRDWPMLARWDGPRRLFPQDWVVGDLDEAEARVLAVTRDDAALAAAGDLARTEARERFDESTTADALVSLVLGSTHGT